MGVAELKKVELYYHKSVEENVARIVQRSGVCQIIESAEGPEARLAETENRLAACEEQEAYLRYLFRTLGSHYTDPVSSIDRLLGERQVFSLDELAQIAQETDLKELVSSVKTTEAKLNELRIEISQHKVNAGILSKIKGFPYPLSVLGEGTRTLKGVLGTLSAAQSEALKQDLTHSAYSKETELFVAPRKTKDKDAWVVVLYLRSREQEILELCVKNGMTLVDLPAHISDTVARESAKISDRLAECEGEESEILQDLACTADEWMPVVQSMSDYWKVLHDRYHALAASVATDSTVRTCFWVPAAAVPALQKQVEAAGSAVAFVVSDPKEEDRPPTLLMNNAFNRPAEVLTNLYSPPAYGQRDPTSPMAPFFFLFFGMCLGDAGYAIVIASVLWLLFKKYRKIPDGTKNFMRLFYVGAAATFLYGAVTGSFFGDFIDAFPFGAFLRPVKDALLIVDPLKNPVAILGISLLLGVVHLMFGLGVAAYDECRRGNYADAAGGKISWILFVMGLLFVGGGSSAMLPRFFYAPGAVMAVVGTGLIFWYAGRGEKNIFLKVGLGLYALYGSTAYLGDILSYSRLLALGLGSAVIGSVINLLGQMIVGVPFVGWLLAFFVVAGGHVFSLAINLLGAFVHAMRLQYVEFFSKFYTGDGVNFNPLKFQTQYVDIFDEI
ncbi:MAG: V-type ATP synthase subunit I [Synergistaceae bacterium]|jgi:V/A-type H+-transporting ATPase subunit I|nr:V-type ATP synthase subunit I [Synergistaceae bacterium]